MGMFLPHPPPPDSDEEEDLEGAAAQISSASIPMDAGEKRTDFPFVSHTVALVLCQCVGTKYIAKPHS